MKIHILCNDIVKESCGLLAEHGLSLYIEHENTNILFDTGYLNVYSKNAEKMGVNLSKTDYIIISHGHYDHCGGLEYFPSSGSFPKLIAHKDAFKKRFAVGNNNNLVNIGTPFDLKDYHGIEGSIVYNDEAVKIAPDTYAACKIPLSTDFEHPEFFLIEDNGKPINDMFNDEQTLVLDTKNGLVIVSGCAHRGIINCIMSAQGLFPGRRIYCVIGGMHMGKASREKIEKTIKHMLEMDIQKIIPLHCTGLNTVCEMKRTLGSRFAEMRCGDIIEL